MTSKKMTNERTKRNEMVMPDDPRVGVGLNELPGPGRFKQDVEFNKFYTLEIAASTSTATSSKFGGSDDDVPIRFNPRYIGMTQEMTSTGHFAGKTGFNGSKMVEKQFFLDNSVAEAAGGRITGGSLGHF
jgi:hypothetical protein